MRLIAVTITALIALAMCAPFSAASESQKELNIIVISTPKEVVTTHFATFRFSANQPVDGFTCKLDKRPAHQCESPVTFRHLKNGEHALSLGTSVHTSHSGQSADVLLRWTIK